VNFCQPSLRSAGLSFCAGLDVVAPEGRALRYSFGEADVGPRSGAGVARFRFWPASAPENFFQP